MEKVIEIRNLVKEYRGLRAVDGIDLHVEEGEIYSLLGPNGAGKTTTVEILEGIRKKTSGEITVLGLDPLRNRKELSSRIGILPQDFNFMANITPSEALKFYKKCLKSKSDVTDLLKEVDLYDKKDTPFENMSGGQKQKLGLAMAMSSDPEILFLDEPTAGLDPFSRRNVWSVIQKMKEAGKTVFLTTHYLDEAEKLSDRVAFIKEGKIVSEGSPEEIIRINHRGDRVILRSESDIVSILSPLGYEVSSENGTVQVVIRDSSEFFEIIDLLKERRVELSDVTMKRESLEDVFMRLVGKVEANEP
ncbi:MAG: ATP-binding cassette domain-containing protein [Thermoplasmata archaeon]